MPAAPLQTLPTTHPAPQTIPQNPNQTFRTMLRSRPLPPVLLVIFALGFLSTHITFPSKPAQKSRSEEPFLSFTRRQQARGCLPRLLVDAPDTLPTAALIIAAGRLVRDQHGVWACLAQEGCARKLAMVCNGSLAAPKAVVGHIGKVGGDVLRCLREDYGYYTAVAVRRPIERWSAEYAVALSREGDEDVRKVKPYLEYMEEFANCGLLDYFDGRGFVCADDDDVQKRVETVLEGFDEGFDVYEGRGGAVYARIRGAFGNGVRRDRPSKKFRAFLGMQRLRGETRFYDAALRVRSAEGRRLC